MKKLIFSLLLFSANCLLATNAIAVKPDNDPGFQFILEVPEDFTIRSHHNSILFGDAAKRKVAIIHFEKKRESDGDHFEKMWSRTLKEVHSSFRIVREVENIPLEFPNIQHVVSARTITLQTSKNPPLGFVRLVLLETKDYLYRLSIGNENSLDELNQLSQKIASKLTLSELKIS